MTFHAVLFRTIRHRLFLHGLLALALSLPGTAQQLPFLDDAMAKGLSPFGYHLDSYRWSQADGLPDRNLFAILQDRHGLMWLSTKSGLATFDGLSFRKVETVNKNLGRALISRMAEDKHGNIWLVNFEDGRFTIDILDPDDQKLRPLHVFLGLDQPVVIPEDDNQFLLYQLDSTIWLGTGKEAYRYDGSWQSVFRASAGKELGDWLPARTGLWDVDRENLRLVDARGETMDLVDLRGYHILNQWVEQDLSLWIGVGTPDRPETDHYLTFLAQGGNISLRQTDTPPPSTWQHDFINSAVGKRSGHWLYHALWQDSLYLGFRSAPRLFNLSRLHTYIDSRNPLYFDREGGLWTTTNDGIIRLVLRPNLPFDRFLADGKPAHSTRGITLLRDRLLVHSYQNARLIDLRDGSVSIFDSPFKNIGLALLAEGPDCWVSSHRNPLLRLAGDGNTESYPFEPQPDFIFSILRTGSGQLLAGTDKGLFRLDPAAGRMVQAGIPDGTVATLFRDGDTLWAGTSRGLLRLDDAGEILQTAWEPDPGNRFAYITHIHRDEEGLFWMSTHGGGLVRWNPATESHRTFTTTDGLSNDFLHAVYPDRSGYLWIPSDFGLMRFNKASGTVQTFFESDGLADNEFNLISHFRTPDGRLFLGGINGVTSFLPDEIPPEAPANSQLRLMEARTFNLRTGKYALQPVIDPSNRPLRLLPSDAYLDLSLSTLHFDRSDLYRFAWKIEGVQDNWIEQATPTIRLSNLPYGRHRLLVRYSRPGNRWSDDILDLPITVVRPFYLDWPFLLLLLLAMTGLAWLFTLWRTRRLAAANLHLEAEVTRRTHQIETDRTLIAKQADELRSLDELKSRFFANVTHELRTPLTLILGPLDRLLQSLQPDQAAAETLLIIRKNALRLLNLVEELLELSRMESGKLHLEEKPTDFHPFLHRLVAAFLPYAEHRGIRLQVDFRCDFDRPVLLDARKWEKIVNNLLGNALKFTPRDGRISLSVDLESADRLVLQVTDTGQGIPPEDLPFVFDRYFQGKSGHSAWQGGAGIGLALCREYVRLFGGELTVDSTPDSGSMFRIACPLRFAEPSPASPMPPEPFIEAETFPVDPPLSGQRPTVLVVEDDRDMLLYIQSCLKADYQLLLADNGLSALQLLEKYPVDLVLSDLMMPEMDGWQLLTTAKNRFPDLPFVLLTARVEVRDRLHALHLGVDDYLTKPFLEAELLARLRNMIGRYETRRAMRLFPTLDAPDSGQPPEPPPQAASFDSKWLTELETLVRSNLSDNRFSVPLMAQGMNITERTLQYKLKSFTGLTPNQYLTEARLQEARHLLESHAYETVTEVCYAVGFKTTQYFSRLMKERFGKSPNEYFY